MTRRLALIIFLGIAAALSSSDAAYAYKVVPSGQPFKVISYMSVDPACASLGRTTVNLVEAPRAGQVSTAFGRDYPSFAATNVRAVCDKRKVPATLVYYRSAPGYVGDDSFEIEVVYPSGNAQRVRFPLSVR